MRHILWDIYIGASNSKWRYFYIT